MRIDDNTLAQARTADVLAFFEKYNGFTFNSRGGEYRCKQHPSLAVKRDRLSWYWHSKGIGGHGVLDYLIKVENIPFRQAFEIVTGTKPTIAKSTQEAEKPKTLTLPEKAGIQFRLYDYLCKQRGIDSEIVSKLIQEKKLYADRRGNVVFVSHDGQGKPKFASVRGTSGDFRGDLAGSDKRYGFNMTASSPSERLYIFESPIDLMSHASIEKIKSGDTESWKQHHRLSLAGTSDTALPFFLNQHKEVKELIICLDNDRAGLDASFDIAGSYAIKGFEARISPSRGKDYNVDLESLKRHEISQSRTPNRSTNIGR